jgi:hypothetical protein
MSLLKQKKINIKQPMKCINLIKLKVLLHCSISLYTLYGLVVSFVFSTFVCLCSTEHIFHKFGSKHYFCEDREWFLYVKNKIWRIFYLKSYGKILWNVFKLAWTSAKKQKLIVITVGFKQGQCLFYQDCVSSILFL